MKVASIRAIRGITYIMILMEEMIPSITFRFNLFKFLIKLKELPGYRLGYLNYSGKVNRPIDCTIK
jgi:hypothetical protein